MNHLQRVSCLCLIVMLFGTTFLRALNLENEYQATVDHIVELVKQQNFDLALTKTESALAHLEQIDSLYLFLDLIKSVGTQFRKEGQPKIAERIFINAIPDKLWRKPFSEEEKSKAAWLYVQVGYNYYVELGEYQKARNAYEFALQYLPKTELREDKVARYIFKELGNIYTRLGDYSAGETMLKEYISVMIELKQFDSAAKGYNDLGLLCQNWGHLEASMKAYQAGISLQGVSRTTKALLYTNFVDSFFADGKFVEAESALSKALQLLEIEEKLDNPYPTLHFLFSHVFKKQSFLHAEQGDFKAALTALDQEFHHLQLYYQNTQRREFGKHYVQKGLLFSKMKDYPKSLAQFQLALQSVLYNYSPKGQHDLPSPEACYAENTIMEALGGMATVYQEWNKAQPNTFYLEQALACYELMHTVEQALRQSYLYESSKLFNLEESREQSENAIRVAYQLYEKTHNKALLYQAFVFAERNRSSLLREAFRASKAAAQAGISEEELAEEGELQRAVSKAQEELFRLRSEEGVADSTLQAAEQTLLGAQDAIRNWLQALESRHPRYYQLKYADEVPTLAQLQQMLGRKEQLIEYFLGEEAIFVFKIDRKGIQLQKLSRPENLTPRILAWRGAIEHYQMPGADRTQLAADYQREAYRLYQELLAPVLQGTEGKSLLLVTSGMLDLLPFEALLTQEVAAGTPFNDYPYLLRDYPVSYTYAASLQWALLQLPRHQGAMGGFAPAFSGQSGWSALSCSADLLESAIGEASGNLFLGNSATIEQLQAQAKRYRLLHLATHAQANPEQGDFSFIVFSDGAGGYDSLFAKDLYLYDLETELVILSACETALGTLYNSEGVISLARAFHYAGARSVVNTLWQVNESANCDLVEGFYTFLNKGQDKRTALQQAKLSYLQNADPRGAHPVYWAGFQLLGNPRPMEAGFPWYGWLVGLMVVGLMVGYLRRRSKEKSEVGSGKSELLQEV
ncbi:CHAT domain-containing protein [Lewinella sp. LCG006]|uniref:CHAT domain-containing protein n=1 Tax=Lewinella sp. LCG006 TaxID=3231911 RepID=UPI00345F5961